MTDENRSTSDEDKRSVLDRLDNMQVNNHQINLERVQRCHRGFDDEPMQFDEHRLAAMLQDLADESPFGHEAFVMRGLARALRGDDEHHKLVLRQRKKGKWDSPADRSAKLIQQATWLLEVDALETEGWQTDAAVHKVAADYALGVSTIYAGIREYTLWKQKFDEFGELIRLATRRTPAPDF